MYEDVTYEAIMKRMLTRIPNSIDKRQGSVIYDAIAPVAAELAQMYIELDSNMKLAFASTSTGEYLELRTSEMGITRHEAIKAKRLGLFFGRDGNPVDIPICSRLTAEDLNYIAVEKLDTGRYVMECETVGVAGNIPEGRMIAIDYLPGVSKAEITDILLPGEDAESDEALLARFLHRVRQPATSGNVHHYKRWALEVPGVGDAKVLPLWSGPGTVKVVIVDTNKQPAPSGLIDEVASYIEDVRPIGADVTIVSGIGKPIEIYGAVVLATGYRIQDIQAEFEQAVTKHLQEIAFVATYVSYAKVGTILLSTPGVIDYSNLKINGAVSNVALADEEIPVLGAVNLVVM